MKKVNKMFSRVCYSMNMRLLIFDGVKTLRVKLGLMAVLVSFFSCSNLYKLKSSELHQEESKKDVKMQTLESTALSYEKLSSVFKQDSANYWMWFRSSNPFTFHPEDGLTAENGDLYVEGNHIGVRIEQENSVEVKSTLKDSSSSEKTSSKEKSVIKDLEKHRKGWNWWWWVFGGAILIASIGFCKRFLRKSIRRGLNP